jgi:hypothetical protein
MRGRGITRKDAPFQNLRRICPRAPAACWALALLFQRVSEKLTSLFCDEARIFQLQGPTLASTFASFPRCCRTAARLISSMDGRLWVSLRPGKKGCKVLLLTSRKLQAAHGMHDASHVMHQTNARLMPWRDIADCRVKHERAAEDVATPPCASGAWSHVNSCLCV